MSDSRHYPWNGCRQERSGPSQEFPASRVLKTTGYLGASLLSFVPTYMTKDHHRKDGKGFEGKETIDFVTRREAKGVSRFSGSDFFEHKRRYNLKKNILRNL